MGAALLRGFQVGGVAALVVGWALTIVGMVKRTRCHHRMAG
jgi:hypothetical protein